MIRIPSVLQQFRALFRPGDCWLDADRVLIDGVSGKVSAVVDQIDPTHAVAQTTSSRQAPSPVAQGALNGARGLVPSPAAVYFSNRPASAWSWLHDGSPMTAVSVAQALDTDASRVLLCTSGSATTNRGLYFGVSTATQLVRVGNGSADALNASTPCPEGVTRVFWHRHNASQYAIGGTNLIPVSGAWSGAAAGDPSSTLALGARTVLTSGGWSGPIGAVYLFRRVLTDGELRVLGAYTRAKYGVTAQ